MRIFLWGCVIVLAFAPIPASATTIYLTSGTSWTVPSDWNSANNSIEVIGGGGGGGGWWIDAYSYGGGGGGGGAYAKATNVSLTPGTSVGYAIGSGGSGGVNYSVGGTGGDTYFCNSTSNCASIAGTAVKAGAKGGAGGSYVQSPGAGGQASASVGSVKYSGGTGGTGGAGYGSNNYGGGGGGAAGLHGAGGSGSGSSGGTGDAGNTSAGANGTQWSASYGSGGGGAGSTNTAGGNGTAGGYYGAGGGAASGGTTGRGGGAGRQGIIVIKYFSPDVTINSNVTARGNVSVTNELSKGSGTFVIDHPLDPKNKLLYHSFVESPDVKNIYDGIATLDNSGRAVISLPRYFLALNRDFRYLVDPIGESMPNLHIAKTIAPRFLGLFGTPVFTVAGGAPGGTISWQVTGIRHDPFIRAFPMIVEVPKGPSAPYAQGMYIYPGPYSKADIQ